MSAWSPADYLRFGDERTRPSVDLVARIAVENPANVIDPFLDALGSDADREAFVARLHGRVRDACPVRRDGRVLFPFRRTFVIAYARGRQS